ncbi:MAG: inorganic diphosphatase [Thermoflavifilum sp.]|nr:inorganic diphosphatase [Thermoflavifilum sp.]
MVQCIIEIPQGSKSKYELDKPTGLLKLDRVLFSAVHYPANYGLIPQTYFTDNDPLDVLVLASMPLTPLCMLEARVIGLMHMTDGEDVDDKIIAVAHHDAAFFHIQDIHDLPAYAIAELKNFFEDYKKLEHKTVKVGDFLDKQAAYACIEESVKRYAEQFGKPHAS